MSDGAGVTPVARRSQPKPSKLYPVLWRFAAERQRIYLRRVVGEIGPWTDDPVLAAYRFTNAFRARGPGEPVPDPAGVRRFLRK